MIWVSSLGLAFGVFLGLVIPGNPLAYGKYSVVLFWRLPTRSSAGYRLINGRIFPFRFGGGFFALAGLGLFLVWFGERLGVDFSPG